MECINNLHQVSSHKGCADHGTCRICICQAATGDYFALGPELAQSSVRRIGQYGILKTGQRSLDRGSIAGKRNQVCCSAVWKKILLVSSLILARWLAKLDNQRKTRRRPGMPTGDRTQSDYS